MLRRWRMCTLALFCIIFWCFLAIEFPLPALYLSNFYTMNTAVDYMYSSNALLICCNDIGRSFITYFYYV